MPRPGFGNSDFSKLSIGTRLFIKPKIVNFADCRIPSRDIPLLDGISSFKRRSPMIPSVNSTISALQAFKARLGVTADNIANVNTDEFKKSRATLKEGTNGGVQVNINRVNTPGHRYQEFEGDQLVEKQSSNVNLEEEVPDMMVTQRSYEANLKVLQTQDKMSGTLLDIMG
jgi:flagellar basal-body rod protein FlgC